MRAIDFHVHHRTGERRFGDAAWESAKQTFGGVVEDADVVEYYRTREMQAVVFDVDAETSDLKRMRNDEIAELVAGSEGVLLGFASVDPWKGATAVAELERCVGLGLKGLKVQPVSQRFFLNDRRFYPLWEYCSDARIPVLVHAGTTGVGAGTPGGAGLRLVHGRPVPYIDDVAADFPNLVIIAAHYGWPWYLEAIAMARHKGNVYLDLSGWAPKYMPLEVQNYANRVMPEKFLFGTDYPLLTPDRWLAEFDALEFKDRSRDLILYENARHVLGIAE